MRQFLEKVIKILRDSESKEDAIERIEEYVKEIHN